MNAPGSWYTGAWCLFVSIFLTFKTLDWMRVCGQVTHTKADSK